MNKKAAWFTSGFALSLAAYVFIASTPAKPHLNDPIQVGVVVFKTCLDGTKIGKKEQARFDEVKIQMEKSIEEKEAALNQLAPKFKDEYLDTLTREAEAELKQKFKTLSQDLSQQQNQYYQFLNQANFQIVQKMTALISKASNTIAKKRGFHLVVNEEACFFVSPELDISAEVIKEIDLLPDTELTDKNN